MLQGGAGGSELAPAVGQTPQFSPTWFVVCPFGGRWQGSEGAGVGAARPLGA